MAHSFRCSNDWLERCSVLNQAAHSAIRGNMVEILFISSETQKSGGERGLGPNIPFNGLPPNDLTTFYQPPSPKHSTTTGTHYGIPETYLSK